MPTKTERIRANLPSTFRAAPSRSPLAALTATFGGELQAAENALAAVMRAHWVGQADRGAERLDDLLRIAALYGLTARPGEGIEAFRLRLLQWIRLFLEGPSTVQGLLRTTAMVLGLPIDDRHEAIDYWWERADPLLVTSLRSGRNAAPLLFGAEAASAAGAAATAATLAGPLPLPPLLDLSEHGRLFLALDGGAVQAIELAAGADDPAAVEPSHVKGRINAALFARVASLEAGRLVLRSPGSGPGSRLTVAEGPGDAAAALLDLAPRSYRGTAARAARYASPLALGAALDLTERRYLRLEVDGSHLAEIDCAGADPAATTPAEIRDAINAGLGLALATLEEERLVLTSPTAGASSAIKFLAAAAQDASGLLLGPHPTAAVGADAAPPRLVGGVDLRAGIDLSEAFNLALRVDGGSERVVDLRGADSAATQLPEMIARIDDALGVPVARHDGRHLILAGPTAGPAGSLVVGVAPENDAAERVLGLAPRSARGLAARAARLESLDIAAGLDLRARSRLALALDHEAPLTLDLGAAAADRALATPVEIAAAINAALGTPVAGSDGARLTLQSPTLGAGSHLALRPLETRRERRFVSRAAITEEASSRLFGRVAIEARGAPATAAEILGQAKLGRGVDLSGARHLRLAVDGGPVVDIDCAGPRPHATLLDEVVAAINAAVGQPVAEAAGVLLRLRSPTRGPGSRLALTTPQASDATQPLLGWEPGTLRGTAASGVAFAGTTDLSGGVDLSAADRLRLAVDGAAPVEIACAGPDPAATTLAQVAIAVNVALGVNVARHDGRRLLLTSPTRGAGSSLEILAPAGPDATALLLGIAAPRLYVGSAAQPARAVGLVELGGGVDLSQRRFLRLGVDRQAPRDLDLAAAAADPTAASLAEIVAAIDAGLEMPLATVEGGRLVLTSPSTGSASRLVFEPAEAGDARRLLFGEAPAEAEGLPAAPAEITGEPDLREGVDLAARSLLRIALDGEEPLDIEVAGALPSDTVAGEVIAAIEAKLPGLASLTPEGRLRLTAAGAEGSRIAVLPLRFLEVEEYLPEAVDGALTEVRHGDRLPLDNHGAAPASARVVFAPPLGAASPGLVDLGEGWLLRLLGAVGAGERVALEAGPEGGIRGTRQRADGSEAPLEPGAILAGPLMPWLALDATGSRAMGKGADGRRRLFLTHSARPEIAVLSERFDAGRAVTLEAGPAAEAPPATEIGGAQVLAGRLDRDAEGWRLLDGEGGTLTRLRPVRAEAAAPLDGLLVAATGILVADSDPPLLRAARLWPLHDVTLRRAAVGELPAVEESYAGVLLADDLGALSLFRRLDGGSALVRAELRRQGEALRLPRDRGERRYLECRGARFDHDRFDQARFAGGLCLEEGIFDVSRFAETPQAAVTPVFASGVPAPIAGAVAIGWANHRPGTLRVNLPVELPPAFGGRFNEDRFALAEDAPERHAGVVAAPPEDPDFLPTRLNAPAEGSRLVEAEVVPTVPIGFQAVALPFSRPVALRGGRRDRPARLFLSAPGLAGFLLVAARETGDYGNRIALAACAAAPGRYDLAVSFAGARFESARAEVLGPPLAASTAELLRPGPLGLLQAKAAGVRVSVSRDGTPEDMPDATPDGDC